MHRRAPPLDNPDLDDPPLSTRRRHARTGIRTRGPIPHPGLAEIPVPVSSPLRGRVCDLEPLGRPPQRPTLLDHTPRQTQPASRRQRSIMVGHRGPPGPNRCVRVVAAHRTRRPPSQPYTTSRAITASSQPSCFWDCGPFGSRRQSRGAAHGVRHGERQCNLDRRPMRRRVLNADDRSQVSTGDYSVGGIY